MILTLLASITEYNLNSVLHGNFKTKTLSHCLAKADKIFLKFNFLWDFFKQENGIGIENIWFVILAFKFEWTQKQLQQWHWHWGRVLFSLSILGVYFSHFYCLVKYFHMVIWWFRWHVYVTEQVIKSGNQIKRVNNLQRIIWRFTKPS